MLVPAVTSRDKRELNDLAGRRFTELAVTRALAEGIP
jgi:hypothetical protein